MNYEYNEGEYNLAKMEIRTIEEALKRHPKAIQDEIAERLGISTRTLGRKMEQYQIDMKAVRDANQ